MTLMEKVCKFPTLTQILWILGLHQARDLSIHIIVRSYQCTITILRCNRLKGCGQYNHTHCLLIERSFACNCITWCKLLYPLSRTWRLSAIIQVLLLHYIYGDFSQCMQQCSYFGRSPFLGVSVNRESTVYVLGSISMVHYLRSTYSAACLLVT